MCFWVCYHGSLTKRNIIYSLFVIIIIFGGTKFLHYLFAFRSSYNEITAILHSNGTYISFLIVTTGIHKHIPSLFMVKGLSLCVKHYPPLRYVSTLFSQCISTFYPNFVFNNSFLKKSNSFRSLLLWLHNVARVKKLNVIADITTKKNEIQKKKIWIEKSENLH